MARLFYSKFIEVIFRICGGWLQKFSHSAAGTIERQIYLVTLYAFGNFMLLNYLSLILSQQQLLLKWHINAVCGVLLWYSNPATYPMISIISAFSGRPPLPTEPTAQFPAHILSTITVAWHHDPKSRPDFVDILANIEKFASNTASFEKLSNISETNRILPSVSALKSQWEQRSISSG